jgi:hypothetical protein
METVMTTTHLPIGRTVYCYFCDEPVVALADAMTITVPEYPRNSLWAHANCVAEEEVRRQEVLPRYVVVVWAIDRVLGGHEEGGWWVTTGKRVLDATFHVEAAAEAVAEGLRLEYPHTGQRSSVLGGEDFDVVVYDRENRSDLHQFDERLALVEHFPVVFPHYE